MTTDYIDADLVALAGKGDLYQLRPRLESISDWPTRRRHMVHMAIAAARNGHLDTLQYLIDSGTEICTAIVKDAMKSDRDANSNILIKYLVKAGMDINIEMDRMSSPLMYAMVLGLSDEYVSYILEQGANPHEYDLNDSWTSMEIVVQTNPNLTAMFLKHGAQARGTRALAIAATKGQVAAVRVLVPYMDVNELVEDLSYIFKDSTPRIRTAMHGAVRNGHTETAQVLLDAGADASLPDSFGDTALDMAKERSFEKLAQMLQRRNM